MEAQDPVADLTALYEQHGAVPGFAVALEHLVASISSAVNEFLASTESPGSDIENQGISSPDQPPASIASLDQTTECLGHSLEGLSVIKAQLENCILTASHSLHVENTVRQIAIEMDTPSRGRKRRQPLRDGEAALTNAFIDARVLTSSEISTAFRCSDKLALGLMFEGEQLARMPRLNDLSRHGSIPTWQVSAITRYAPDLVGAALHEYDAKLTDFVTSGRRALRTLNNRAQKVFNTLHPEASSVRRKRAHEKRTVYLEPEFDGLVTLIAKLPAEAGVAIDNTLNDLAAAVKTERTADTRTAAQIKADALVALVLAPPRAADNPAARTATKFALTMDVGSEFPKAVPFLGKRIPWHHCGETASLGALADHGHLAPDATARILQGRSFARGHGGVLRAAGYTGAHRDTNLDRVDNVADTGLHSTNPISTDQHVADRYSADPVSTDPNSTDQDNAEAGNPLRTLAQSEPVDPVDPADSSAPPAAPDALDNILDGRVRANVIVTIPYSVLTGESDVGAHVDGIGEISAESALRIAALAPTLTRMLTDPATGVALGLEQNRYRVDAKLREHLMARTQSCEFPGCGASVHRTDADHIQDWRSGGKTNPENLQLLCRKHHNLKTHLGWRCRRLDDGRTEWTSPLGSIFYAAPVPLHEPDPPF